LARLRDAIRRSRCLVFYDGSTSTRVPVSSCSSGDPRSGLIRVTRAGRPSRSKHPPCPLSNRSTWGRPRPEATPFEPVVPSPSPARHPHLDGIRPLVGHASGDWAAWRVVRSSARSGLSGDTAPRTRYQFEYVTRCGRRRSGNVLENGSRCRARTVTRCLLCGR